MSVKTMAAALNATSPQKAKQLDAPAVAAKKAQKNPLPPALVAVPSAQLDSHRVLAKDAPDRVHENASFFVRVQNGVAHVTGYFGNVFLYIETQIGDAAGSTKVWVLGYVSGGRQVLKASLEPFLLRLDEWLAPVMAKLNAASARTKTKVLGVTAPIYATMAGGVLHVRATIADSTFFIYERVSGSWSQISAQTLCLYSMAHEAVGARARPIWIFASSKLTTANGAISIATQQSWVRTRDGALYIQAAIGNTLVRMKVASNDRFFGPAFAAYSTMRALVNKYTASVLAKVASVFDKAKSQLHQILAPYLAKCQSMATYAKTMVNNMVVEVKVRMSTQLRSLQDLSSVCYVKFKQGFVYIHGLIGDKVLYLKISLTEFTHCFTGRVLELRNTTQMHAIAAKDSIHGMAVSVIQTTRNKASTLSSKAGVIVTDKSVQVTAAGAVGGGATGLATGSIVGAVCGIVPAFFTFGLSIPVFASVGGAAGLCTGSLAGGVTARSIHAHKDDIKSSFVDAMSKAGSGKEYIINTATGGREYISKKAKGCTDFVGESTMMVKAKLGGTGGTAADSD